MRDETNEPEGVLSRKEVAGHRQAWKAHKICDSHEALRAENERLRGERDATAKNLDTMNERQRLEWSRAETAEAEVERLRGERDDWRDFANTFAYHDRMCANQAFKGCSCGYEESRDLLDGEAGKDGTE